MEARSYAGSCHCGKVRFEATTDLSSVMECNCSICSRAGYLLTFVPADNFKLLSGEDNLTSYHFNKMKIDHAFCKTCGVRSFGQGKNRDGTPMYAVNVRTLQGVDLKSLQIKQVDGKSS